MSYLHPLRLHFAGEFEAAPSTVNNDINHYDNARFQPEFQLPQSGGNANGWWNPEGDHRFTLRCNVTSAQYTDGTTANPASDAVLTLVVKNSGRPLGKIVDLDPQQQLVSMIWGLRIDLVNPTGAFLLRGQFAPAAFTDIWVRGDSGGGDERAAAMYQSVLESLQWGDLSRCRFLQELQSVASDGVLSIKFNLDGYSMTRGSAGFTKGRLVGTIGPGMAAEPRHFVQGRHLSVVENNNPGGLFVIPKHGINYCAAIVDEVAGKVRLDLGNALSTSPSKGPLKDVGALSLVCDVNNASGARTVTLGPIPIQSDGWYERTAAVVDLPADRALSSQELTDLLQNPLSLVITPPVGPTTIAVSEPRDGIHVRADQFVARLNPGEDFSASFRVSRFGKPLPSARIALTHRTFDSFGDEPPLGVPQSALEFLDRVVCDANGQGVARLRANSPGNPRGYIDGQVFLVDYALEGVEPRNPSDYLSVLAWDAFTSPEQPTWNNSMQAIFTQYGNLYPVMKQFFDMTNYEDVSANILTILQALNLPVTDAHYMPVSRDLSAAKRAAMIRWLSNPGPDGKPLFQVAGKATDDPGTPGALLGPRSQAKIASTSPVESERRWIARNVGERVRLSEFRSTIVPLTRAERELLIDQAMLTLELVYVHLPLKRAMHAIDPLQRLRLLKLRHVDSEGNFRLDERSFQSEMISIFVSLRDLHTNYVLPRGYTTKFAFLPFHIEECYEDGARKYVVTWVSELSDTKPLRWEAVVTHWNGSPIELAVARNAEREAGSNLEARRAQGVEALTLRWLGMSLPPDEDWVKLTYVQDGQTLESRFDWEIIDAKDKIDLLSSFYHGASDVGDAFSWGLDLKTHLQRSMRKMLFDPAAVRNEVKMHGYRSQGATMGLPTTKPPDNESLFPNVFPRFGIRQTPSGSFGYVRLASFAPGEGDVDGAVRELVRILQLLRETRGLILDIRDNPGGYVNFGERCLQLLSPRPIVPEPFHFVASPMTLRIADDTGLKNWKSSIAEAIEIGSGFSQGFPLTSETACNDIGQEYQGPVVLIVNAMCYSTSDIFAAGFQDHDLGIVLGTHKCTGAGGANVWDVRVLQQFSLLPTNPFMQLPQGAQMRVAARRSTRVGRQAGMVLEDLGVVPEKNYCMTAHDVLNSNEALIAYAASLLKDRPRYVLEISESDGPPVTRIKIATSGVERVDTHIEDRPAVSRDVADGEYEFSLPWKVETGQTIQARGYRSGALVVTKRFKVK